MMTTMTHKPKHIASYIYFFSTNDGLTPQMRSDFGFETNEWNSSKLIEPEQVKANMRVGTATFFVSGFFAKLVALRN